MKNIFYFAVIITILSCQNNNHPKRIISKTNKDIVSSDTISKKSEITFIHTEKTFHKQLEKYKGKIIFVDTWFTSCGSCMKQFGYMKDLDNFFYKNDIVPLFICFGKNKDKEKWKKIVQKYQLKGEHLFLENKHIAGYKKNFKVKYNKTLFHAAPRYLIIDQKGKVIDDFAPRPIEKQKIINIINKVL